MLSLVNTEATSVKKGLLKSFVNFTEKHLCWSLFLIKFSCEICKIFENTYFEKLLQMTASINKVGLLDYAHFFIAQRPTSLYNYYLLV